MKSFRPFGPLMGKGKVSKFFVKIIVPIAETPVSGQRR